MLLFHIIPAGGRRRHLGLCEEEYGMGTSSALLALLCGIGFSFLNSCYKSSNLQALLLQAIAVDLSAVAWNQACRIFIHLLV